MARAHFGILAELFNERTFRHIRALGIGAGWHCWEAGAGGGSVPTWLCERVGPTGQVVASDVDTFALEETTARPYQVLRQDLTVDPPPAVARFDLVHARLVLEHLSNPAGALMTLADALRPGGWLLVESSDPASQPLACPDQIGPSQALANKVRQSFWDVLGQRTDLALGRTLPRLLRDAGLIDVDAEAANSLGGPDARQLQRTLTERMGPSLVATGRLTADEIGQHCADLESPDLDIAVFPVVSAWG
ncbi:MAG TPA: methyltransferase domain-containing protein, partial [Mycobacterium sp.]|nr:methyltransferase domain-containing protein [Mycobacterium sp.]